MGDIVNVVFPHVTDPVALVSLDKFTIAATRKGGGKWSVTISDIPDMNQEVITRLVSKYLMTISVGLTHMNEEGDGNNMLCNVSFYESGEISWTGHFPENEDEKAWFRESLEIVMAKDVSDVGR